MSKNASLSIFSARAIVADPRWASLQAKTPPSERTGADAFYYSVLSTGIYCRAGCASRLPRPENTQFHATPEAAEAAGFRPCKRCQPQRPGRAPAWQKKIEAACRLIEQSETPPSLAELARSAASSPSRFHRLFKASTGLTPKAYGAAARAKRVASALPRAAEEASGGGAASENIARASLDAGYGSSAAFYQDAKKRLGMTPSALKKGGEGAIVQFATGTCSLGEILVARSEKGLCAITLGDDAESLIVDLHKRFARATLIPGDLAFDRWVAEVVGFVDAPQKGLSLPLDIQGTLFQERVWRALTKIPLGTTKSYEELAAEIGAPKSARAVAGACAANALAVAIPCHRIVKKDGGLSGYRWGIEKKQALLDKERARAA